MAWLVIAQFVTVSVIGVSGDPTQMAAEYYFSRHDYRQALSLFSEVGKKNPSNLQVALRLADLKLMLEGRESGRDVILSLLKNYSHSLTNAMKEEAAAHLSRMQSLFLTDEGLLSFSLALTKIRKKDCLSALPLLVKSVTQEKGNTRVLGEKARCEKQLFSETSQSSASPTQYLETLKAAHALSPLEGGLLDNLGEAFHFLKDYPQVLKFLDGSLDFRTSSRQQTAYAVALMESNRFDQALPILVSIMENHKTRGIHPITLFTMGKILSSRSQSHTEAIGYLGRFLLTMSRPEVAQIDGWDPYHSLERMPEARAILESLESGRKG